MQKFITIFNRDINLSSVNSIFMNKEGREIVFSLGHISSNNNYSMNNNHTGGLLHWYLEDETSYKKHGAELIGELKKTGMFIIPYSNEDNRLDIINKNNVSYIKYDNKNLKITFNFKNSICKRGEWVSDFIHWKFSSNESYLVEETNVTSSIHN